MSTTNNTVPATSVTIKLDTPITLKNGSVLNAVVMRSPTVRDRLFRSKDRAPDLEADINMICHLTGLEYDDMLGMEGSDYLRLEAHFSNFLLPLAKRQSNI